MTGGGGGTPRYVLGLLGIDLCLPTHIHDFHFQKNFPKIFSFQNWFRPLNGDTFLLTL